jgi:hypothetical protein
MIYLKLSTMEYPRFEGDIRLEYPEIAEDQTGDSFPCPDTYVKVQFASPPKFDVEQHQYLKELPPQQIDGVWTQIFQINVYTEEELLQIAEYEKEAKKMQNEFAPKHVKDLNNPGSAPNVIG